MNSQKVQSLSSFAWSIAEILRGDFKQSEYGKVILPFVVLRRLDCILKSSKNVVLEAARSLPRGVDEPTRDMILFSAVGGGAKVYNLSSLTFEKLKGQDPGRLHQNLPSRSRGSSPRAPRRSIQSSACELSDLFTG
jgi:type I restriction enzyme M protein